MSKKSTLAKSKQVTSRQTPAILGRKRKYEAEKDDDDDGSFVAVRKKVEDCDHAYHEPCSAHKPLMDDIKQYCFSSMACQQLSVPNDNVIFPMESQSPLWKRFQCSVGLSHPVPFSFEDRLSPLPMLSWAHPDDVWKQMIRKDNLYRRDREVMSRHPGLQARMRAILLDWLIEVCEVYRLNRETYYLALDFVDRYLSAKTDILKQQLQLIGITALFIAAKLEEIYPPKLSEFSYVTDGACTESEILDQELIMLKGLNWDLTPMTVNSWVKIYLQLVNMDNLASGGDSFIMQQFSGHVFLQIAQLLDLFMLDVGCLQFSYSVLAASTIHHMISDQVALSVSRYRLSEIESCVFWMTPFVITVREVCGSQLKFIHQGSSDDVHNIQVHAVTLQLLECAQARQNDYRSKTNGCNTPKSKESSTAELTPPHSNEKSVVV